MYSLYLNIHIGRVLHAQILGWWLVLLSLGNLPAQSAIEDVVTLHNGSQLRGTLVNQVPGQSITLRLLDGQELTFAEAEVDRIERQAASFRKYKPQFRSGAKPYYPFHPGWYVGYAIGLGFGTNAWGPTASIYLDARAGYRFKPWLQTGVGLSLSPYENGLLNPVYLDLHGVLRPQRIAPYYQLQMGYALTTSLVDNSFTQFRGGLMLHPAVGVRIQTVRGRNLIFSLGYRALEAYEAYSEFVWDTQGNRREIQVEGTRLMQRYTFQVSVLY